MWKKRKTWKKSRDVVSEGVATFVKIRAFFILSERFLSRMTQKRWTSRELDTVTSEIDHIYVYIYICFFELLMENLNGFCVVYEIRSEHK